MFIEMIRIENIQPQPGLNAFMITIFYKHLTSLRSYRPSRSFQQTLNRNETSISICACLCNLW